MKEMPTVVSRRVFCVRAHPRPRFWMADTRSRTTKAVKVCKQDRVSRRIGSNDEDRSLEYQAPNEVNESLTRALFVVRNVCSYEKQTQRIEEYSPKCGECNGVNGRNCGSGKTTSIFRLINTLPHNDIMSFKGSNRRRDPEKGKEAHHSLFSP